MNRMIKRFRIIYNDDDSIRSYSEGDTANETVTKREYFETDDFNEFAQKLREGGIDVNSYEEFVALREEL